MTWKPEVAAYRTWMGEPRVNVTLEDGRKHSLTLDEAAALQDSLRETIKDIEDGEPDDE